MRQLNTTATTAAIFLQILIGATMRHTGAGLAIPDFPWMFGHVVPDHWSAPIAIHFAHRVGAVVVTVGVIASSAYVWSRHRDRPELTRPATLILALVATQVTLGALTVLTRRDVWINSLHVVGGALVLTTSLVLTLWSWRGGLHVDVRLKPDTTGDCGERQRRCPAQPDRRGGA
jgi:cytochrome c oxidase assembly protein subunit 15